MSDAGAKILEGLKQAIEGNYARVTIDRQSWVREDFAECVALRRELSGLADKIERLRAALRELYAWHGTSNPMPYALRIKILELLNDEQALPSNDGQSGDGKNG